MLIKQAFFSLFTGNPNLSEILSLISISKKNLEIVEHLQGQHVDLVKLLTTYKGENLIFMCDLFCLKNKNIDHKIKIIKKLV